MLNVETAGGELSRHRSFTPRIQQASEDVMPPSAPIFICLGDSSFVVVCISQQPLACWHHLAKRASTKAIGRRIAVCRHESIGAKRRTKRGNVDEKQEMWFVVPVCVLMGLTLSRDDLSLHNFNFRMNVTPQLLTDVMNQRLKFPLLNR